MKVDTEDVMYVLYNASIHITYKTKKTTKDLRMKLLLLPPYSPSLVPTEWEFGMIKRN